MDHPWIIRLYTESFNLLQNGAGLYDEPIQVKIQTSWLWVVCIAAMLVDKTKENLFTKFA